MSPLVEVVSGLKNSDGINRGLRGGSTVHRTEIEDPIGNSRKQLKKNIVFVSEEEENLCWVPNQH